MLERIQHRTNASISGCVFASFCGLIRSEDHRTANPAGLCYCQNEETSENEKGVGRSIKNDARVKLRSTEPKVSKRTITGVGDAVDRPYS